MLTVKLIAKQILPAPVNRFLGRKHRELVFPKAMKRFMRDPVYAATQPDLIAKCIYGWGNEGFSGRDEYLAACLGEVLESDGPILECGSGLSTLLLGAVAQVTGRALWSLENSEIWGSKTQKALDKYGITSVRLCVAPLKDYGEFSWYEPLLVEMPDRFSLVICDGPPRKTHGARYGLLPLMKNQLCGQCIILFDDVVSEQEEAILLRWVEEFGVHYIVHGSRKPYARVVTAPNSSL